MKGSVRQWPALAVALAAFGIWATGIAAAQNPGGDVRLLNLEKEIRAEISKATKSVASPYMTQMRQGETKTIEYWLDRGLYADAVMCERDLCNDLRLELRDKNGRAIETESRPILRGGARGTVLFYGLADNRTDLRLRVTMTRCSYDPCWVLLTKYQLPSGP